MWIFKGFTDSYRTERRKLLWFYILIGLCVFIGGVVFLALSSLFAANGALGAIGLPVDPVSWYAIAVVFTGSVFMVLVGGKLLREAASILESKPRE